MLKLTIGSLLLLAIFVCTVSLCEAKTVSLRHSHHKDGALTIIIDMGGEGKKSKETKETKTKETKETEETKPKLDDTTKDIVAQVSKAISKEEEKKLAESLLTLGNELTQVSYFVFHTHYNNNYGNLTAMYKCTCYPTTTNHLQQQQQ